MPLGFVLPHQTLELATAEQLQNLAKDAAYSIQGGMLRSEDWFFSGNPDFSIELPP
jgi:hypothetical protein